VVDGKWKQNIGAAQHSCSIEYARIFSPEQKLILIL